jgi:hypothetical protein
MKVFITLDQNFNLFIEDFMEVSLNQLINNKNIWLLYVEVSENVCNKVEDQFPTINIERYYNERFK